MPNSLSLRVIALLACVAAAAGCSDDDSPQGDLGPDATAEVIGDTTADAGADVGEGPDAVEDTGGDADAAEEVGADAPLPEPEPVTGIDPPPMPAGELGFAPPEREPAGEAPTEQEIEEFTLRLMAFYADTGFWDWVYRTTHGLHESYDEDMMPYRLWWQRTGMERNGDTVTFAHRLWAANIAMRTVKILDAASAAYVLTGEERLAELAADMMRGMVALSLGFESAREDPITKYLQARAVFNHDHSYDVDGREVIVDYEDAREERAKWNVHAFEIPDNPEYGSVWVANMRSKDDVPYMYKTLELATRIHHQVDHPELKQASELYIEYMRGFSQSIVDHDWYILTRYEDGEAAVQYDVDKEGNPEADLGNFVTYSDIAGPDAECTAQLGAALTGYGFFGGKGDCGGGLAGWDFEQIAFAGNSFNYNILNYFHMAALANAILWGHTTLAERLMDGLVERFDRILFNGSMPDNGFVEHGPDSAAWLVTAAAKGYPLTAREARHIMEWYGESADFYRGWEHWDPWTSLPEGQFFKDFKPPREETVTNGDGEEEVIQYVRLTEMPYIFEYCQSPYRAEDGVEFIDCDIVADPARWDDALE
ncbi:MAG: hypothetical protein ACQEXJ_14520 [Myxococcota bacterium]